MKVVVLLSLFAFAVALMPDGCWADDTEWQLPEFCQKWEERTGCPRNYAPVCADGNREFSTECVMCQKIKQQRLNVSSYEKGPCEGSPGRRG